MVTFKLFFDKSPIEAPKSVKTRAENVKKNCQCLFSLVHDASWKLPEIPAKNPHWPEERLGKKSKTIFI